MTRRTIQGLQDLLNSDIQTALLNGGVDLPIDTGEGQENLTFNGTASGDTLTATASFEGLSFPTFSGLTQIVKHTTISALAKARPKAALSALHRSGLNVSIDKKSQALAQIELDVDPRLSHLLGDPSLPDGLSLSGGSVSLTIDPQQKSYTFACEASAGEGGWAIVNGFSLGGLGLTVTGTISASPAISLDADVTIAGADIKLSAERAAGSAKKSEGEKEGTEAPAPGWKFSGQLAKEKKIALSGLVDDVGRKLGVTVPSFASDVTLDKLALEFDTGTKDFSFTSDSEATGAIDLEIGAAEKSVVFTYHSPKGSDIDIKQLVSGVSQDLGSSMPAMRVSLTDAVFVRTGGEKSKLFFGIDIGGGIDLSSLSGLPIVGSALAGDKTVKLSYQIVASSDAFTADEAKALQKQLGDKFTTVPATISKGVNIRSLLKLGEETKEVELPVTLSGNQVQADSGGSGAHWFKLQKTFGPVHLEQVGVAYKAGELELLLQASMELGGLSVSLDGLGISSPLSHLSPTFHLDGLGIAYAMDPLKIGGAFRRKEVQENGNTFVEYDGAAVLQADLEAQKLSVHAIGSYAYFKDHPSLFLYAFVDYPLGGPPFLFVEGLAAAFGYNRSLTVPDIEGVSEFPLVKEAMGGTGADTTSVANLATALTGELDKLANYIKPSVGAGFLAVGVKFSSFKMIESFAMLTVELGDRFEVDLLGVSDLRVPCDTEEKVEPLAELRMILKASFVPSDGCFGRVGALDKSSYILSKQCTLTGGFAQYAWFGGGHAGDFIITLGGYHPSFEIPSHYPKIPRLGYNWRVDNSIVIKGEAYYALCAHALMAGGNLDASYHAGKVHASFTAGADFLISWQPYHYDINARASIKAGIGALSAHVGADLHLWGPKFGGQARIKIVVVKVTIKFGGQGSTSPAPISWSAFQGSFLPDQSKMCAITVQSGLVRKLKATVDSKPVDLYVVNPKTFAIATDSFFPTNQAIVGTSAQNVSYPSFGIRPMGVSASDLKSKHTITITREVGKNWQDYASSFSVTPLRKKAPSGIWGNPVVKDNRLQPPSVNEPRFVVEKDLDPVSGFQLVPAKAPPPGHSLDIPRSQLQYDTCVPKGFGGWQTLPLFRPSTSDDTARRKTLRNTVTTNPRRDTILKALGYNPAEDVQIDPIALDASLVIAPQVA